MIRVISVHHHALRVGASAEALAEARRFYNHVLQLASDPGRPHIEGVPGEWLYAGTDEHRSQIHVVAAEGVSPLARDGVDPAAPHIAFGVASVDEAREWLASTGTRYVEIGDAVGTVQLFVRDPHGNLIELHEAGSCRCTTADG